MPTEPTPGDALNASYRAQQAFYANKYKDKHAREDGTYFSEDSVSAWLMRQTHQCVDPLLEHYPQAYWLTVGDGRFGRDAHYIAAKGVRVLASDISDVLLAKAQATGYIREYRQENAEALSFANDTFDFVLCKHSYHHFPRPMLAVYEMLRVARTGVVLIEPTEVPLLESPSFIGKRLVKALMLRLGLGRWLRTHDTSILRPYQNFYEAAGNYVYTLSERTIEQLALAQNLPMLAVKYLYSSGHTCDQPDAPATPARIAQLEAAIRAAEQRAQRGVNRHGPADIAVCIFKVTPPESVRTALARHGFRVMELTRNPHVPQPG